MRQVTPERSYWRDIQLSVRHRTYGFNLPCVDLDHVVVEYDNCRPCALLEYKHERARPISPDNASIRAISHLADSAQIPFFVVRYLDDFSEWQITPINGKAREILPDHQTVNEIGFVKFLYRLRGKPMPKEVFDSVFALAAD